jgi:hypothetical protein
LAWRRWSWPHVLIVVHLHRDPQDALPRWTAGGPGGDCERLPVHTRGAGKEPLPGAVYAILQLFRFVRYRWRCSTEVSRKADFPRKARRSGTTATRCVPNRRCRKPALVRRSRRRLHRRHDLTGRHRCRVAGRCLRPLRARSPLPRRLLGSEGRTWCRAGCSP